MLLYRITHAKYADDLSGNGARFFGGRWNSAGRPMLYLASSRSLAILESLAHIVTTNVPDDYVLLTLDAPDDHIAISIDVLPDRWNEYPELNITRKIGDSFLQKNECLFLKVPSALVPEESNYLMNPMHPKAVKIKVIKQVPYCFDERLL